MDIVSKITGNTCSATEFNQIPTELEAVQTSSGQTSSDAILNQVSIGVSRYAANNFYLDSGTADNYLLTLASSFTNPVSATVGYFTGMTIRFRAGNAGTGGAATVNVNGAGVKSLKESDGTTNPVSIPTTEDTEWRYDGTVFRRSSTNPSSYALLTYAVSSGTDGGGNAAGAWTTRPINTENYDPNNIVSLSANRFTLGAGTYLITTSQTHWSFLGAGGDSASGRIRNITDSTTLIVAETQHRNFALSSNGATLSVKTPTYKFTINSSKTFELQYYRDAIQTSNGLGVNSSTGESEIYASIFIQKI